MIDHKELMKQGNDLIAANLAECCREELEWQNTALLRNGKMREAGSIYAQVDSYHALSIVQSEVARQAMQVVAATPQVVADERAAFESAQRKYHYPLAEADLRQDKIGNYYSTITQANWSMWQSRAALAASPVQAQEPVAQVRSDVERANVIWLGKMPPHGTMLYAAQVQPVAVPDGWNSFANKKPAENSAFIWRKDGMIGLGWYLAEDEAEWTCEWIANDVLLNLPAAPAAQVDAKVAS